MANRYEVVTEFTLMDRASSVLNKMGPAGTAMSGALQNSFDAAQERVTAFGNSIKTGLKTAAAVGLGAVAAGVGIATKQYIDFESEARKAGSLFGDLDSAAPDFEQKLKGIETSARNVAAATEFNATDTSKSLESFAMAGYDSKTAMDLLAPTADLATAAQVSLGEATDIATASLGALGKSANAENLTNISDIFAKTAASSRTSVQTIFEAVQYAGPTFTAAGQSVTTLSAAIAALGNAGVDGSNAGTALNAVFTQLSQSAKQKELAALGVTVKDSAGNFLDLSDIIGQLEVALDGMGNAEKSAILNSVFGTRGVKAMNILLEEGSTAFNTYRNSLDNASGAALKMATSMRNSLANRIEVLKSALTELGFKFIEVFSAKGGDAITKLTDAISSFDPTPIANALSSIISNVVSFVKVAWEMRGVILAVAIAVTTYRVVMDAAVIITNTYTAITSIITAAQIAYATVVNGSAAAQAALTFATNETKIATFIFSGALKAGMAIQAAFNAVANSTAVQMVTSKIVMIATSVASGIYSAAMGVATVATGAFTAALDALTANPIGLLIAAIIAAIAALIAIIVLCVKHWDDITAAIGRFGNWLQWLGGEILSGLQTAWNAVSNFFIMIGDKILHFLFGENAPAVEQWISNIGTQIGAFFGNIFSSIGTFFVNIGTSIGSFFSGTWITITTFFSGIWETISSWASNVFSSIGSFFVGIGTAVSSKINEIITGIQTAIQPVVSFIQGIFDTIANMWTNLTSAFSAGGLVGALKYIGSCIFAFMLEPIKGVLNALSWIPGLGDKLSSAANYIDTMQSGLIGSNIDNETATQAPTQTAATANSYSRQESVSTSRVEIGLEKGLQSKTSGSAPGITVQRSSSGAF